MYAYWEGSSWKNCVEWLMVVGNSRILEKVTVEATFFTEFWMNVVEEAGWTVAQKRSKRKVSKTSRTISMVGQDAARAQGHLVVYQLTDVDFEYVKSWSCRRRRRRWWRKDIDDIGKGNLFLDSDPMGSGSFLRVSSPPISNGRA